MTTQRSMTGAPERARPPAAGATAAAGGARAAVVYPWPVRAVHWLSAGAIACAFAIAWLREALDEDHLRDLLVGVHRQLGLAVLLLWALRLALRRTAKGVAPPTAGPAWQRVVATLVHVVLYGLLVAMPLLGWALTNAHGHPVRIGGLVPLPALTGTDPDLADTLQEWHEAAGWALLAIVALHAGAALWHHLRLRDGVLRAMWPARRER